MVHLCAAACVYLVLKRVLYIDDQAQIDYMFEVWEALFKLGVFLERNKHSAGATRETRPSRSTTQTDRAIKYQERVCPPPAL